MLSLKSKTSPEWVRQVETHLPEVLIDHAHCEKKAAGVAMHMIFWYVEQEELAEELSNIVTEELEHFRQVLQILRQRGIAFRRLPPSSYGKRLHDLIRPREPERAVDRCLIAALIEARSCERFAVLRDGLADRELAEFYGTLFESEARHHATYVQFACRFAEEAEVFARLEELAAAESEIIRQPDKYVRVHS